MWTRLRNAAALVLALAAVHARPAVAQRSAAAEQIALGDREYAERRPRGALDHYVLALHDEAKNYEALWKASRVEVDLAEQTPKGPALDALLTGAQQHAEAAIAANPAGVDGHFSLGRAMGRKALSVGTRERIRYAKLIRSEAVEALRLDSTHAGALHVLGMWNAEIMRLSGLARGFARTFLGAGVFSKASWDEAQRLLELSVRYDPDRIVHHLDLGMIYADRSNTAKATEQFELVAKLPVRDFNDERYKQQAAERRRSF